MSSVQPLANYGATKDGCSQSRTADHLTRTPTTTSGKRCSSKQRYATVVSTTPGTRHTALFILAVPTPTAVAIMGWSSAAMATRSQHVLDCIRRDVATQMGALLWDLETNPNGDDHDQGGVTGTSDAE
jgi:hypothetical protein